MAQGLFLFMYAFKVSEKQLQVIRDSCYLMDKVRAGDVDYAFNYLPYKKEVDKELVKGIKHNLNYMLSDNMERKVFFPTFLDFLEKIPSGITKEQMQKISTSCDLLARIYMGQIREVFDYLPFKADVDYEKIWVIRGFLSNVLPEVLIHGIDGNASSLGVGSPDLHKDSNIAVDIHHVIRHRLSWEGAVERGIVDNEHSPRKWPEMLYVSYLI